MKRLILLGASVALLWPSASEAQTRWRIEPSSKFDALCLATIVGGDPYTGQFYPVEREAFSARLSPAGRAAAERISTAFREAGVPLIGWLGLVYSTTEGGSIADMIAATRDPASLRTALEATEYWNAERWSLFERTREDMLIYLQDLEATGYEAWWRDAAEPEVTAVLTDLRPRIEALDIAPVLTRVLRRPVGEITVYATRFCRPFGARLTGSRFIMDVVNKRDAFRSVGAGALHEMTHPPFDMEDPRALALVDLLEQDPTIRRHWEGRPRESGYNTFSGYVNEDVTRALDQIIGERVGVTFMDDADQRWREQEGGFHFAAGVFYHLFKEEAFLDGEESVLEFLDRMRREGRLQPGPVEAISNRIYAGAGADGAE